MTKENPHWAIELLKDTQTSPKDLEDLKHIFENDINSPRRMESIKTVADLVDCLARRDVINDENVEPIRVIAGHCRDERLMRAVNTHPLPNKPAPPGHNEYREQRLVEDAQRYLHIKNNNSQLNPQYQNGSNNFISNFQQKQPTGAVLTDEQRAAIYKKIAQSIGRDWRKLGRELKLTEGALDEIELQHPRDFPARMYAVFRKFEEDECNRPYEVFNILCNALDECPRKDIRRQIQAIVRL